MPRSPYLGRVLHALGISADALEGLETGPGVSQEAAGVVERITTPSSNSPANRGRDVGPRAQGGDAASSIVGLVRDALIGAVDRALARDHELEATRRGYRILGDAFLDLGLKLQLNGVDTHELMTYARELQKMGDA